MPKLTKEQLEKVKYVSMVDFASKVDQIEGFKDKVEFATMYLLSHGMNGAQTDYTLEEAIHLVRLKLIDESKRLRDKIYAGGENDPDPADLYLDENENAVDPYAEDEKDDIENQFFLGNPGLYLKGKAEKFAKELNDQEMQIGIQKHFKENCERLAETLDGAKTYQILSAEEKGMNTLNIKARMEQKYRGREFFAKAEESTRPGFFTRAFGTRSTAGKNFDEVYAAFNNPHHALYGNMKALKTATTQYLEYKASKRSAMENAAGLRVREPKEGFAERLLDVINEQEKNDEVFKPIVGNSYRRNLTQDDVDRIKGVELEENSHRQPIILDLDDESENSYEDSMEDSRDMSVEEEVEAEEESLTA